MAKIVYERDKCAEHTNRYREIAETILDEEQAVLSAIQNDGTDAAFKRLSLADLMLNLASNFIVIDGVSQAMYKQRNEDALNDARKALYRSIIYLEEIVSNYLDSPYSDYEDKVKVIENVTPAERYLLVRKMGLAINLLVNAYGDNTKWRWTFVELEGRYTTVAKNIINLKDIVTNSSFDSPHYEPTVRHLTLVKKLFTQAADRYRERYELSTNSLEDFKMGINFLSALRRLNIVTGDQNEAATIKRKLDIWTVKLATDIDKQKKLEKLEKE